MTQRTKFAIAALIALGISGVSATQAATTQIDQLGQWYAFDVDDLSALSGGKEWIDLGDDFGAPLSFSFTLGQPTILRVVDAGFAGDRFNVTVSGSVDLALTTGTAIDSYPVAGDFDEAWADARFSRLAYTLGPGSYTVTGDLLIAAGGGAPLNVTTGAVMLAPVPEADVWMLMLAGLGLLGLARRRAA